MYLKSYHAGRLKHLSDLTNTERCSTRYQSLKKEYTDPFKPVFVAAFPSCVGTVYDGLNNKPQQKTPVVMFSVVVSYHNVCYYIVNVVITCGIYLTCAVPHLLY